MDIKQLFGNVGGYQGDTTIQFTEPVYTGEGITLPAGTIGHMTSSYAAIVQIVISEWFGSSVKSFTVLETALKTARYYTLPKKGDYVQLQIPVFGTNKTLGVVATEPKKSTFITVFADVGGKVKKAIVKPEEVIFLSEDEIHNYYIQKDKKNIWKTYLDFNSLGLKDAADYDVPEISEGLEHVESCVVSGSKVQLIEDLPVKGGYTTLAGSVLDLGKNISHGWITISAVDGEAVSNAKAKRDEIKAVPYLAPYKGSTVVTVIPGHDMLHNCPGMVTEDGGGYKTVLVFSKHKTPLKLVTLHATEIAVVSSWVMTDSFSSADLNVLLEGYQTAIAKLEKSKPIQPGFVSKGEDLVAGPSKYVKITQTYHDGGKVLLPGEVFEYEALLNGAYKLSTKHMHCVYSPNDKIMFKNHYKALAGELIEYLYEGGYNGSVKTGKKWLGIVLKDSVNELDNVSALWSPVNGFSEVGKAANSVKLKVTADSYLPISYSQALDKYPAEVVDHLFLELKNFKKYVGAVVTADFHYTSYSPMGKPPIAHSIKKMHVAMGKMGDAVEEANSNMKGAFDSWGNTYYNWDMPVAEPAPYISTKFEFNPSGDVWAVANADSDNWKNKNWQNAAKITYVGDKPMIYTQITAPVGGTYKVGDKWYNADTGVQSVWLGNEWVQDYVNIPMPMSTAKKGGIKYQKLDRNGNVIPTGGITAGLLPNKSQLEDYMNSSLTKKAKANKAVAVADYEVGDVVKLMNPLKPSSMDGYKPGAMMVISKVLVGDSVEEQDFVSGDVVYYAGPLDHDPVKWTRHGGYQIYLGSELELYKKAKGAGKK